LAKNREQVTREQGTGRKTNTRTCREISLYRGSRRRCGGGEMKPMPNPFAILWLSGCKVPTSRPENKPPKISVAGSRRSTEIYEKRKYIAPILCNFSLELHSKQAPFAIKNYSGIPGFRDTPFGISYFGVPELSRNRVITLRREMTAVAPVPPAKTAQFGKRIDAHLSRASH